ncbi:hypothetical protein hmeg3_21275 [Herbaspirillum sp. meg3]|nr:hypothetical protein hmeg3_21275 [Herbaspirillum sp. meg3]
MYFLRGTTSDAAHQSMIALFCRTRGYSNDMLSWIIGLFRRPYVFDKGSFGVLGAVRGEEESEAVQQLRKEGYYVFRNRLPEDLCDRLLAYAVSAPCKLRPMDGTALGAPQMAVYHREAPQAVRYEFLAQDLLNNDDVQALLADMSFASLAQEYLGARPVIDIVALWWHTKFSDKPDAEAAQYFHFDMDRPKWLKFFIYLSDVGPENGPHSFIAGSHRSNAISPELLNKGYSRLTDDEVREQFDDDRFIEFSAPRGTIIAEDTRGLHKGKHVESGDRLVMQIEFSNSLFGAYYPKTYLRPDLVPNLAAAVGRYPDLYTYLQGQ